MADSGSRKLFLRCSGRERLEWHLASANVPEQSATCRSVLSLLLLQSHEAAHYLRVDTCTVIFVREVLAESAPNKARRYVR